jgi:hypothetical protein
MCMSCSLGLGGNGGVWGKGKEAGESSEIYTVAVREDK